jgi:peroxiredoxin
MSFQDKLAALREKSRRESDAANSAEMRDAVAQLVTAEEKARPLRVGGIAPVFVLPDANSVMISSADLLLRGPIIVTFYRGLWCPYCQRDLRTFVEAVPDLHSADASVVAISHQLASDSSRRFQQDNRIGFPVLEDETGDVAVRFGIRWAPEDVQLIEDQLGTIGTFRGTEPWIVPMQARYVIGQDGVIAFAEVAFDYSQRSDPTAVLPVLRQLKDAP